MAVETINLTSQRTICLVGNPNTGKSVIFGRLTGKYVIVSNYPGTTVEILKGTATIRGQRVTVVDTPGTNSLIPMSEDEQVTRDILLEDPPDLVLQVGDAKNLKRVLAITVQLAEMNLPCTLALNMMDEARMRGIHIDTDKLSAELGIPVVGTVAVEGTGMDRLVQNLDHDRRPALLVRYPEAIEEAVTAISELLPEGIHGKRGVALMILSGDESLRRWLVRNLDPVRLNQIEGIRAALAATTALPLTQIISRHRALAVQRLFALVTQKTEGRESALAAFLGRTMMHPFWGVPWLALVLYVTWLVVGVFGAGTVVDLIEEGLFNGYINPAAVRVFSFVPVPFLRDLFVGEYGIITMALTYGIAIVLPVVFFFFVTFGVLEDSGYLPRLAVQVNQIFRRLGLNGKAVLPMVLGLGCDTMATLTTRILETRRERTIVTLLLALGVPCSAQLGVILGLLTTAKSLFIWAGVVGLVLLAVGYLAGKVMPGQSSDFILEVPPVRLPRLGNILYKTLARTEWYLKEALPLFVLGTLVLFVLDRLGLLGMIEQWSAPVVTGVLGLPEEAAKVFIMGFLRRDYGGAGLKTMFDAGQLSDDQVLVSIVTLTLFIPCVANFLVMAKERGWKTAFAMAAFIVPVAVLTGGAVRLLLRSGIL